jgi:serine/threonine protein kinase
MNRYETIRLLGKGGMGSVYEVINQVTGERLALKTMLDTEARHLLRFKREFRVMAELEHPNLVRIHELGVTNGEWFFTMEYVDGVDLLTSLHQSSSARQATNASISSVSVETVAARPYARPQPANQEDRSATRSSLDALPDVRQGDSATRASLDALSNHSAASAPAVAPPSPLNRAADEHALTRSLHDADARSVAPEPAADDPFSALTAIDNLGEAPISLAIFQASMGQILDAIEFLHAHGIIHRDLKPSNVMVNHAGQVKVLDFGLASREDRSVAISRTGAVVGTVAYMAPEQFTDDPVTTAADLYALGCIMFQILTGRPPLTGAPAKVMYERLHQPPPRLARHIRNIPPALDALCARMMSREANARPTIQEIRAVLGVVRDPKHGASSSSQSSAPRLSTGDLLSFVGRDRELQQLERWIDDALDGNLRFILIEGDHGIGKSALARQALRIARQRGMLAFKGRCHEREHLPFVAIDRAVDALVLTLSRWPSARLDPARAAIAALVPIFPAIAMLLGDSAPHAPTDSRRDATPSAIQAFCDLLNACQLEAPLLFSLEDLQWTDLHSVDLLTAVLERCCGRVIFLAMTRPADPSKHPEAKRLKALGRGSDSVRRLRLGPMLTEDTAQLISSTARTLRDHITLDPLTLTTLTNAAEGNPRLALQLLDHISNLNDSERATYLTTLHHTGSMIDAQIAQLGDSARRVLELASLSVNMPLEAVLLSASALSSIDFDASLAALEATHLAERVTTPASRAAPSQEPLRRLHIIHPQRVLDSTRQRLSPPTILAHHAAMATALDTCAPSLRADVEALLHHLRAQGAHDRCRARALDAATHAERAHRFEDAASFLSAALDSADEHTPPIDLALDHERRGENLELCGDFSAASQSYRAALAIWDKAPSTHDLHSARIRLLGRLSESLVLHGRVKEGLEHFEHGMRLSGLRINYRRRTNRLPPIGLLLVFLFLSLLPRRLIQRKEQPRDTEHQRFFVHALRLLAPIHTAAAPELILRSLILALRIGSRHTMQRMLAMKVIGLIFIKPHTPRLAKALQRDLDEAEAIARAHNVPLGPELVMASRSLHALLARKPRARQMIDEAIDAIARQGLHYSHDVGHTQGIRAFVLWYTGALDELIAHSELHLKQRANVFTASITGALCVQAHLTRGDLSSAQDTLRRVTEFTQELPPCQETRMHTVSRVRILLFSGDPLAALDEGDLIDRAWHSSGEYLSGYNLSFWLDTLIEAALAALHRQSLPHARCELARRRALLLLRLNVFDLNCFGHRALALIAHHAGQTRHAAHSLRLCLEASSLLYTNPYRRWLCLETARDLGVMTFDIEAEALDLQQRFGFVHPWRSTPEPTR